MGMSKEAYIKQLENQIEELQTRLSETNGYYDSMSVKCEECRTQIALYRMYGEVHKMTNDALGFGGLPHE